ncbi:MAG TPA: hypothetical protein VMX38_20685 [Verrucomicrobiae bacterium]|jgi:hypothetical protein|nr:hypothetical protein [Verrucomicrobiae bacterium]
MRRITSVITALLFAISLLPFVGNPKTASAQEKSNSTNAPAAEQPMNAYRVDLAFNEMEDGKKVNTRHYSIDLTAGRPDEIKIGTRIPVATSDSSTTQASGNTQYQYIDLGTSVEAQLINHEQELHISGEISSIDTTAGPERSATLLPVVRQIRIQGSTALVLGKPIVIGIADDPNSKRQFQLEATVTKLN